MDFLERMNLATEYIETNLTGEIDYRELALLIGCSEYHLSRMFPFITGQGLALYIRRRRMSQAAMDLNHAGVDVLETAVKYGYSSVDAFARSFREVHGVTPAAVKNEQIPVRLFSKLTFTMAIKGAEAMVYRITDKEAFRILGISKRVGLVFEGLNGEIDAMWKTVTAEHIARWKSLSNTEPTGIVSASTNFSEGRMEGNGTLDHYIGAATTQPANHVEACLEVEPGTWAVFEAVGDFPATLQSTWGRIYSEWFPSSDFELRKGPEILWNEGPDTTKPDFKSEIWIPVKRKA